MKWLFKQAVCFNVKVDGKDVQYSYRNGQTEDVPKVVEQHPYFQAMVKSGCVDEPGKDVPTVLETPQQRAERLYKKLSHPAPVPAVKPSEEKVPDKKKKG